MRQTLSILVRFLWLGCHAFGGPLAHLAWFERTFVQRLNWIRAEEFLSLVALCQALPGPASSQVAMAIGYRRGGWSGFWAAWIGFTLPSAVLMLAAALTAARLEGALRDDLTRGLQVAVVAVIALAIYRMARGLFDSPSRIVAALIFALFFTVTSSALVVLLTLLLVLLLSLKEADLAPAFMHPAEIAASRTAPWLILTGALALLFEGASWATNGSIMAVVSAFYRTGLLVFGGGHVVLPLLQGLIVEPGWLDADTFLLGYGFAQLMPGPLFSFSAFVGGSLGHSLGDSLMLGLLALGAIYLPSFLLLGWLLPGWQRASADPRWKAALLSLHPAVVGLLAATWINPVASGALNSWMDAGVALILLLLLAYLPRLTLPLLAVATSLYVFIF